MLPVCFEFVSSMLQLCSYKDSKAGIEYAATFKHNNLQGERDAIFWNKHVVHENLIYGSGIIWVFPLVIADSERDLPGMETWAPRLANLRSDHWATRSEAIRWPGNSGVPPTIAIL
jgi:hypothetical protein